METGGKGDHNYAKRDGDPLNECPDCRGNFTTTKRLKRHIKIEHMSDADKLTYLSENPTETSEYSVKMDDVEMGGKGEKNAGIVKSENDTEIQEKDCTTETVIPKEKRESNSVRYKCLKCDKCYDSMTELSVHIDRHQDDPVFRCTTCGFCFMLLSILTNHLKEAHDQVSPDGLLEDQMNTDLVETLYECPLCKQSFTEQKTMSLHKCQNQRITTKKEFVCGDCGLPYKHISSLRTHVLYQHMKSELFLCEKCGKDFKYKWDLKIHFLHIHKDTRLFICKDPAKTLENSLENDDDMEKGKNDAGILAVKSANDIESNIIVLFKCLRCDKSFYSSSELSVHNESHQEDAVYKCTTCGLCFTQLSLLTNHLNEAPGQVSPDGLLGDHMNIDVGKTLYQCPVCKLSFTEQKTMSLHKCQNQCIPTKETYYCGDCGKPYITISNLGKHMLTKHRKSIFWCEKCGDDFTYKTDLELHKVFMHPDAKPFVCGKCGKSCPSLTKLKEHEFAHSQVQKHTCIDMICDCHYCGKQFMAKDLLKTHLKLHCECTPMNYLKREHWPFKCEECECRFRYFYAFKAHTSHMHTILKPLKCPECEKCFASSVILNLHMKTYGPLLEDHMNTLLPICTQQDGDCKNITCLSGNDTKTPILKVSAGNKVKKLKDRHCTEKDEEIPVENPENEEQKPQSILTTLLTSKSTLCPASSVQFSGPGDVKTQLHRAHMKTYGVAWDLHECGKINGKREKQWKFKVERQIPCPDCGRKFSNWHLLQKHQKLDQVEHPYKCDMCDRRFRRTYELKRHKLLVHIDEELASLQLLTRHIQTHWICSHLGCKQTFRSLRQLKQHRQMHSIAKKANLGNSGADADESKQYPCLYCKERFVTFSEAQTHIKSHGELKFEPVQRKSEMNMFNKDLNLSGSDTDANMDSDADMSTHSGACIKTHLPVTHPIACIHAVSTDEHNSNDCEKEESKPFPCLQCNACYSTGSDLEAHKQVHNDSEAMKDLHHLLNDNPMDFEDNTKQHPCLACHKCFTSNSDLEAHLKTHIHVNSKDSCLVNGELNFTDADVNTPVGDKCDIPMQVD